MIEAGKYYRTRGGTKAYVAGKSPFPKTPETNMFLGWEETQYDTVIVNSWTPNGRISNILAHRFDLISEWRDPISLERWANVYSDGVIYCYPSKEQADKCAAENRIACIKLTGIEGQE
jgi:hypothetical protein